MLERSISLRINVSFKCIFLKPAEDSVICQLFREGSARSIVIAYSEKKLLQRDNFIIIENYHLYFGSDNLKRNENVGFYFHATRVLTEW